MATTDGVTNDAVAPTSELGDPESSAPRSSTIPPVGYLGVLAIPFALALIVVVRARRKSVVSDRSAR